MHLCSREHTLLLMLCVVRSQDEEQVGGAAAAFAKREEDRARERRSHKSKRRKPSSSWDVAPRGFEHISPLQYKAMQGKDGLGSMARYEVACGRSVNPPPLAWLG